MPNHVMNVLTLRGEPEQLLQLMESVKYDRLGTGSVDFNKIIPMPETLDIEAGSRTDRGLKFYRAFVEVYTLVGTCNMDRLAMIPKESEEIFLRQRADIPVDEWELGKTAWNNLQRYGAPTWYEWCTQHWGSFDENGQHDEDNGSESMIIHGDNLEALKSLLPQYEGRVKCIYIDPPYNTGNEGWVYNDNVNDPRIKKWLGEVVGKEGEDLSRHDKWLCMMYPRLKLLQKLLAEDGVIFASLDYHEQPVMRLIMDEVFGASNYVSEIACVNKPSGRSDDKYIANRKMGLCDRS